MNSRLTVVLVLILAAFYAGVWIYVVSVAMPVLTKAVSR